MPRRLQQQVTGASSGIGRAIALEAAKRGYAVAAAARRKPELEALCDEIKLTHGVDARPIPVDLATSAGAQKLHDATADLNVRLVVANAGLSAIGDYAALPVSKIEQMAGVNMISVAVLCRLYGATLPEGACVLAYTFQRANVSIDTPNVRKLASSFRNSPSAMLWKNWTPRMA